MNARHTHQCLVPSDAKIDKLPDLVLLAQSIPDRVRPEEIVEIAERVDMQEWILAGERLNGVLPMQAHDVSQAVPSLRGHILIEPEQIPVHAIHQ